MDISKTQTGIPTPHIAAKLGDFAPTVLMPGDPLRAKFIAENFLHQARQVTGVRNVYGYTGDYKGQKVSVMASGMGMPSILIYAHELFTFYDVERIVRIGSAGGLQDDIKPKDILIAMGASTDSKANRSRFLNHDFAAIADFHLLETTVCKARELGIAVRVGNIFSSDLFYKSQEIFRHYQKMGILATEMEAAALYGLAAELGKSALCILTVVDNIFSGEIMDSEEREVGLKTMIRLSLEAALCF